MDFLQRFHQAFATLKTRPGASVRGVAAGEPTQPLVWSKVPKRGKHGLGKLPATLRALYEEVDYLTAEWSYHDPAVHSCVLIGDVGVSGIQSVARQRRGGFHDVTTSEFWDENLPADWIARLSEYRLFDVMPQKTCTIWREVEGEVELALYLGGTRLHILPLTPWQYLEAGLSLCYLELWQLLFIAEAEQDDYADALGTLVHYARQVFPDALPGLPGYVLQRFSGLLPVASGPDYVRRYEDLVANLRTVPHLTVELFTTSWLGFFSLVASGPVDEFLQETGARGASLGTFERVRREMGLAVSPELRAFYSQMNGCRLRWQLAAASPAAAGDLHGQLWLLPLEQVFGGRKAWERKHWDDNLYDGVTWGSGHLDRVAGLRGLRLFEVVPDEVWPGVKLQPAPQEADLHLLWGSKADILTKLPLDFAAYVEAAFASAGLDGWQRLLLPSGLELAEAQQLLNAARRLGNWCQLPVSAAT
jgi:hypothetical protein